MPFSPANARGRGGRTQVTVGRGLDITYQLVSKTCPLMISRKHCVFQQNAEGQWTVKDNKSLNGVWLNKQRLDPSKVYPIAEGDRIQLGVPLENRETAEYEYEVIKDEWEKIRPFLAQRSDLGKAKSSRTKRKCSLEELETSGSEGPSNSRCKRDRMSFNNEPSDKSWAEAEEARRLTEKMDAKLSSPGPSDGDSGPVHGSPVDSKKAVTVPQKDQKGSGLAESWTGLKMLRKSLVDTMKLKVKVQEKQSEVLNVKQKHRKCDQKDIFLMEQELQELQNQLCMEQEHQQQQVEELERTFCKEQQKLEGEKCQQEENLKEQLAQVLQEASDYESRFGLTHRALMEELNRNKKDFEEIIRAKNKELEETKEEKEKVRAQKEEVLNQMNDVLENELQCTICSEHFIEAVTLNCAHSFCSYCINEWMRRKVECPICRQEIKSKTRSLVLDNCINRMVEKLDVEMKEHRLNLIRERKEKQNVMSKPAIDNDNSVPSFTNSILSMSSCDNEDSEEDSSYSESYYVI
ncbi:E3 ubiquitin-protein ligase RNF8 isoform X3 [Parus major]|uniref:E3 ubiquitin-protein ligase RNF8 isoform X3 n=1 Tax=Parus major TaxID=9157 RepID=UPI001443B62B|nr:E3 ubiquitin-protein ligase RNF8 isoform X3 [Parus major]